jgi:chromate transporter
MAIVAAATLRIGRKALKNGFMWALAALAFVAIFALNVPFPAIIGSAALVGWIGHHWRPGLFKTSDRSAASPDSEHDDANFAIHTKPSWTRTARILVFGLLLWWTPVLLAGMAQGWDQTLFHEGMFFSKAAMVTFGGAYAVLPYVAQQAVETHAWLTAPQMLDGLAFAETTPGPLIMVVQHVGFMGGWTQPDGLSPLTSATLGALLTTWVTFVPCFLWIFLGAPHVEQLRGHARVDAALSAVTAAVVGVILNLAVWFGWHVIHPGGETINWFAIFVGSAAFAAILTLKLDLVIIVLAGGIAGVLHHLIV